MKLKAIPCRYCGALIGFVEKAGSHKNVPVEPNPTMRDTADPLSPGIYYTMDGESFEAAVVPIRVPVYRQHKQDCEEARPEP